MSIRVIHGDCLQELPRLAELGEKFEACVTDPPYHLTTGKKGGTGVASLNLDSPAGRSRVTTGFMGTVWDGGDVAFRPETWRAVYNVLLPGAYLLCFGGTRTWHRVACAIEDAGFEIRDTICWLYGNGFNKVGYIKNQDGSHVQQGWGGALKPAFEPIIVARKPLIGAVAQNVLTHGTGAINIDAARVSLSCDESKIGRPLREALPGDPDVPETRFGISSGSRAAGVTTEGRWPANVAHDGSDEVEAAFEAFGDKAPAAGRTRRIDRSPFSTGTGQSEISQVYNDTGTASRFYYSAKAGAADRADSKHPTIKPTALLRWLVQLVTPPGGRVLDPFAGSGSTGLAADQLGFDAVLIEQEAEYVEDIRRKITADAPLFAEVM